MYYVLVQQKKHIIDREIYLVVPPKPSRRYLKGTIKTKLQKCMNTVTWTALLFTLSILCMVLEIYRKNNTGDRIAYRVSMLISLYNKYTHGVDVFDQIRRLFGIDLVHPSKNTL